MKNLVIIVLLIVKLSFVAQSQNRELTGKIIDDGLIIENSAIILVNDSVQVGKSDSLGFFFINIPNSSKILSFWNAGREITKIEINDKCSYFEIIMLSRPNYDVSISKFNRYRKRQFKKLNHLRKLAYKKGIFKQKEKCYKQLFIPM